MDPGEIEFVAVLLTVGAVWTMATRTIRAWFLNRRWRVAADELQLSLEPATFFRPPRLTGMIGDVPVQVSVHGGGEGASRFTRFAAGDPTPDRPHALPRRSDGTIVALADLLVDVPFFQGEHVVATEDPGEVIVSLDSEGRKRFDRCRNARLRIDSVVIKNFGVVRGPEHLVRTLKLLLPAAEALRHVDAPGAVGFDRGSRGEQTSFESAGGPVRPEPAIEPEPAGAQPRSGSLDDDGWIVPPIGGA